MNLTRLTYFSQRNPSEKLDLRGLIQICHRNNSRAGVTGILHYGGDQFLQVLEGGRAEVSAIYHRIARDPRHMNIILISCTDARERLFPTWSMALNEGMDERTRDVFLRYFSTASINPEIVNVDSLHDVLQDIAAEL